jgi:tetratricopeptide (TPR) repeat protein
MAAASSRKNAMNRFDLLLLGYRNDLAKEKTLRFLAQQGMAVGVKPLQRDTPLPYLLWERIDHDLGLDLLAHLRGCGAQARLVASAEETEKPAEICPNDVGKVAPPAAHPLRSLLLLLLFVLCAGLYLDRGRGGRLPAHSTPLGESVFQSIQIRPLQLAAQQHLNDEALQLNAAGDFTSAAERLRIALSREPKQPVLRQNLRVVLYNAAVEHLQAGDASEAIDLLSEGLRIEEDASLLSLLGVAYSHQNTWGQARDALERSLELQQGDATTLVALGKVYRQQGNRDQAVEMFQRAREAGASGEDFEQALTKLERELDAEWGFSEMISPHFQIGFAEGENREAARMVLSSLEDAYFSVGRKLNFYPPERTPVVLYATEQFYDITQAPSWTGGVYDGRIKLPVRGLLEGDPVLDRTLRHEFGHVLITTLSRNHAPVWLSEGAAIWVEEEQEGEREAWALGVIEGRPLMRLSALNRPFLHLAEDEMPLAYAQSYLAVRAILDSHGASRLRELIVALGQERNVETAFERVLGTQLVTFEQNLLNSLAG